jgi:hypothetical protein
LNGAGAPEQEFTMTASNLTVPMSDLPIKRTTPAAGGASRRKLPTPVGQASRPRKSGAASAPVRNRIAPLLLVLLLILKVAWLAYKFKVAIFAYLYWLG